MLNIISMTALLFVMTFFVIFIFIMFCTIIGGNKNKSEYERIMEDEEQMNYLRNYKNRGNKLPIILTRNQAIAYAVVALNTLKVSPNDITEKILADEIPVIMKLHKKNEIVERSNKILNKRKEL